MKFEDAFNAAFEIEKVKQKFNVKFGVHKDTAKQFAFFWNMLALSDGKFDDIVSIDDNMNIVSESLKKQKKETTTTKKGQKKSSIKTAKKDVLDDDNNSGNTAS